MFRRPTDAAADDEITDDLLDSIPDVGEEAPAGAAPPLAGLVRRTPPLDPTPLKAAPTVDVRVVLGQVRREMEASFARELDHVEDAFARVLQNMQEKLDLANADLMSARAEQQRVKAEHDRKTEALRELKRTLDSI